MVWMSHVAEESLNSCDLVGDDHESLATRVQLGLRISRVVCLVGGAKHEVLF